MASNYSAQVAALAASRNFDAILVIAIEMAGKLDSDARDAMDRRSVWAEQKRKQRENVRKTSECPQDNVDSPVSPIPPSNYKLPDPPTEDVPPPRHARRARRVADRSDAVRQNWLTPIATVWSARCGAFPWGEAGKALKPVHESGLSGEDIAARLTAYLDDLDANNGARFLSISNFAKRHQQYANGSPVDSDLAALLAESSGGYRA